MMSIPYLFPKLQMQGPHFWNGGVRITVGPLPSETTITGDSHKNTQSFEIVIWAYSKWRKFTLKKSTKSWLEQ